MADSTLAGTAALGSRTVHRMGYGAMQLAGPGVFGPPRDKDAAIAVLRRAVELGIDHIDTSDYYGPHVVNDLLREALHPFDGIALVSKVGAKRSEKGDWLPWDAPADLRQGIEENLARLGVDKLAAVNLRHMEGRDEHPWAAQVEAMAQAKADGLIDGVGLSTVTLAQLDEALAITDVACVQNAYSYADRSSQDVLDRCTERGIAFVPYFPLGSAFGIADVRTDPNVIAAAEEVGATASQVALRWILDQSPVTMLIPGTSSVAHLEENVAAADLPSGLLSAG